MKKIICLILFCGFFWGDNILKIQNFIKDRYINHYKDFSIQIKKITPYFSKDSQISKIKIKNLDFVNQDFGPVGSLKVIFSYQNQDYTQVLRYEIDADIKVIYAKFPIKKSQDITSSNTALKTIALKDLKTSILSQKDLDLVSAKVFIPQDTFITLYQIEPKILIRRNDSFNAYYRDGNITIQTVLVAKENGKKDDVIEAINPETKKSVRVKVLENGNGEIL